MVIERGLDINEPSSDGWFPLHRAFLGEVEEYRGPTEPTFWRTKLLLSLGANAGVRSPEGDTIIDLADSSTGSLDLGYKIQRWIHESRS